MMGNLTTAELAHILAENPDIHLDNPDALAGVGELERRAVQAERDLQIAVFVEAERRALVDARWALLFAIPNGQYRRGQRPEPGIQPGVPDICLPVACKGFHGAYIELKVKRNQPSAKQRSWASLLAAQGYFVASVWDDPAEVIEILAWYLEDT